MAIQTSFTYAYDNVQAGVQYGIGLQQIVTGFSDTVIPFGRALVYDAVNPETGGRKNVSLPSAATNTFVGIARFEHTEPDATSARNTITTSGATSTQYDANEDISILEIGKIYVEVEQAVAPGDPVFVRFASGAGGSELGKFRANADTATAFALENAEWVTSTTGVGKAVLHIYK